MTAPESRHYRFGARDRPGWLLGLGATQCIALGGGVLAAGIALNVEMAAPLVLSPLVASAVFAFGRWDGSPVHELAPVGLAWLLCRATGSTTWFADLPRTRARGDESGCQPSLPPSLVGLTITEGREPGWTHGGRLASAAVVHDARDQTVSATLRVHGCAFALCERDEQERLLQLWGDALAAFCAERGSVARVRWTEWTAPAGLDEQLAYLDDNYAPNGSSAPVESYRELLLRAGPMATRHEILVTVTVDQRRTRRRRRRSAADREATTEEVLRDEVRLLTSRLETAGLIVEPPLTPSELAAVVRARLDPYGAPYALARNRSLAGLTGLVSPRNAGPLAVSAAWDHTQVDGALHIAYVIAEWPRLEVPPNWMEPLVLYAGGIRTIAVHYEPVAPSRSQRIVDRDSVKLASDEEQRARTGFRITARHRRAQSETLARESELVAGFGEFEFTGFVIVTGRDPDELERSAGEYEQVAAQIGLELRRLDGRHDLALACALPIGRGIAPRRFP